MRVDRHMSRERPGSFDNHLQKRPLKIPKNTHTQNPIQYLVESALHDIKHTYEVLQ